MAAKNVNISRRQFLKASASAVVSLAVVGSVAYYFKDKSEVEKTGIIRPPGSREEKEFLFACIKCGLCVQICPIHAIKLADWDSGLSYGTPYIDTNVQACDYSCDAIQCAETCPTAAINFQLFKNAGNKAIEDLTKKYNGNLPKNVNPFKVQIIAMKNADRMGVAKIPDSKQCLAYQGNGYHGKLGKTHSLLRPPGKTERLYIDEVEVNKEICDLCVAYCPIEGAIKLKDLGDKKFLPEITDACVGCGVCQMLCPTDPKAIVVEPFKELVNA